MLVAILLLSTIHPWETTSRITILSLLLSSFGLSHLVLSFPPSDNKKHLSPIPFLCYTNKLPKTQLSSLRPKCEHQPMAEPWIRALVPASMGRGTSQVLLCRDPRISAGTRF